MDRKKLMIILGAATAFFAIVAVVLFVLGLVLELATFPKVLLIIISVLCLVLAGELGYFTYLMVDTKPNYFLYNPSAKRNISVQKLTFAMINSRMNRFLSGYAASEGRLWNDRVLDNPYLDIAPEFKPLVAYKMLYGLAEKDAEPGWKCLENSSEETIKYICDGLVANGDGEFAGYIGSMMSERPANIKLMRDYLIRNKKYMQAKMTKYVVENINLF